MPNLEIEAKRIVDTAKDQDAVIRVIGGLAIFIQSPSAKGLRLSRSYQDVDLVGYSSQRQLINRVFLGLGYQPNKRFNALQGHRRLLYFSAKEDYSVDVFMDVFPMCHLINFKGRLNEETYTVPLPELLLSKLQVIELNEKDLKDALALISDHEIKLKPEVGGIAMRPILSIASKDWGWYNTIYKNLDRLENVASSYLEEGMENVVRGRIRLLRDELKIAPKSIRWKLRALIGERVRWYNLPEEVAH